MKLNIGGREFHTEAQRYDHSNEVMNHRIMEGTTWVAHLAKHRGSWRADTTIARTENVKASGRTMRDAFFTFVEKYVAATEVAR